MDFIAAVGCQDQEQQSCDFHSTTALQASQPSTCGKTRQKRGKTIDKWGNQRLITKTDQYKSRVSCRGTGQVNTVNYPGFLWNLLKQPASLSRLHLEQTLAVKLKPPAQLPDGRSVRGPSG